MISRILTVNVAWRRNPPSYLRPQVAWGSEDGWFVRVTWVGWSLSVFAYMEATDVL